MPEDREPRFEQPAAESTPAPWPGASPVSSAAGSVADGKDRSLDRRSIAVQRIAGAISASVLSLALLVGTIGAVAATSVGLIRVLLALGLWAVITIAVGLLALLWPPIRYRHTSYRLDDHGMQIRSGVWWKSTVNVPHSRVQHTDVQQGPVERGFGLATLIIHTAGTQHAAIPLSGLAHPIALEIRDYLLEDAEGPPGER